MEHSEWVRLALEALALAGVMPAARRWLSVGRRARSASLVAQLAQEVLISVMRRHKVSADDASTMEDAVHVLKSRLVASGVDPLKAEDVARSALAGAAHPAEDLAAMSKRVLLEGKPPVQ